MAWFDRFLGRKRSTADVHGMQAGPARMAGAAALVSTEDQQATRARMEAELQAQRAKRAPTDAP